MSSLADQDLMPLETSTLPVFDFEHHLPVSSIWDFLGHRDTRQVCQRGPVGNDELVHAIRADSPGSHS